MELMAKWRVGLGANNFWFSYDLLVSNLDNLNVAQFDF